MRLNISSSKVWKRSLITVKEITWVLSTLSCQQGLQTKLTVTTSFSTITPRACHFKLHPMGVCYHKHGESERTCMQQLFFWLLSRAPQWKLTSSCGDPSPLIAPQGPLWEPAWCTGTDHWAHSLCLLQASDTRDPPQREFSDTLPARTHTEEHKGRGTCWKKGRHGSVPEQMLAVGLHLSETCKHICRGPHKRQPSPKKPSSKVSWCVLTEGTCVLSTWCLGKESRSLGEKSSLCLCSRKMCFGLPMPLLPTGRTENRHAQRLREQQLSVLPSSFCDLQSLQFQWDGGPATQSLCRLTTLAWSRRLYHGFWTSVTTRLDSLTQTVCTTDRKDDLLPIAPATIPLLRQIRVFPLSPSLAREAWEIRGSRSTQVWTTHLVDCNRPQWSLGIISLMYFPPDIKVHAQSLSHVQLFVTPWTVACQALLSKQFSRQEYWSGLPFPAPDYKGTVC